MKSDKNESLASAVEAASPGFHGPVKKKVPVMASVGRGAGRSALLAAAAMVMGPSAIHPVSTRNSQPFLVPCGKPKNLNNDPDRAKGMKEFCFDRQGQLDPNNPDPEYRIYAGTLKAARKKYALLTRNSE